MENIFPLLTAKFCPIKAYKISVFVLYSYRSCVSSESNVQKEHQNDCESNRHLQLFQNSPEILFLDIFKANESHSKNLM